MERITNGEPTNTLGIIDLKTIFYVFFIIFIKKTFLTFLFVERFSYFLVARI